MFNPQIAWKTDYLETGRKGQLIWPDLPSLVYCEIIKRKM
jgi:hypothetical protein